MHPSGTEIYHEWMKGESINSIAKRYKLEKGQVRRIVNRVVEQRSAETMRELPHEEADSKRGL